MKKTAFASLLLTALTTNAFASPATSTIPLQGGSLAPKYGEYVMNLQGLYEGVNYKIECLAEYNTREGADVYVSLNSSYSELYVDGKKTTGTILKLHDQYAFGHDVAIQHVTTSAQQQIKFVNLDDKAIVNFRNCVAKVE